MTWLTIMLRMKPGQSVDAATAALREVQPQIRAGALPKDIQEARSFLKQPFTLSPVAGGRSPLRNRFERPLMIDAGRGGGRARHRLREHRQLTARSRYPRRHELSVRIALGASRWDLTRQLLTESIVLASIGAVAGVVCGSWASRAIVSQLSTSATPVVLDPSLDWRVLTFTAATTVATAVLFGAAPALRATRVAPIEALKEQGRSPASESGHLADALIIAQVALSLVLVTVAGLFVATFQRLAHAPLGLDRDRALVVTVTAPTVPGTERNVFYHRLVRTVAGLPGIAAVGGSFSPPIVGGLRGVFVVSEPGARPLRTPSLSRRRQRSHPDGSRRMGCRFGPVARR